MKKTILSAIFCVMYASASQAAVVPLASFDAVSSSSTSTVFYGDFLGAGKSVARGFELLGSGGNVDIEFMSMRVPTFAPTAISVSYYLDSNNDNLLDTAVDTLLGSMSTAQLAMMQALGLGQALFVNYINLTTSSVVVNTAFTPINEQGPSPVPLPAAAWLFGSALLFGGYRQFRV